MTRYDIDRTGAERAAAARMVLASVIWIGLAGLLVFHVDREVSTDAVFGVPAMSDVPACAASAADCLHAPVGDPSVPAADRALARRSLDDAIPPIPTF
jgi:hypothetical protein